MEMERERPHRHVTIHDDDGNPIGQVHPDDWETLIKSHWYVDRSTGYLRRGRDGMYMHRLVMGLNQKSKWRYNVVDHIDGNRSNNCRCNLRICSAAENARNRRYNWRERKTSVYRGVCYAYGRKGRILSKPWRAMIRVEKALVNLGYFPTQVAAARAYNVAAERLHGPYAVPNQLPPEEHEDDEERRYWQQAEEWEAMEASRFLFDPHASVDRYQHQEEAA